MGNSTRPINELTGVKKPSSVLVRGNSHMEIAKQIGAIPQWYTEVEYVEWAKGPRGFSTYDLWTQMEGNAGKTLEEFLDFLGFLEATQNAVLVAQLVDAVDDAEAQVVLATAQVALAVIEKNAAVAAKDAAIVAKDAAIAAAASVVGGSLAQGAIFNLNTSNNVANPFTHVDITAGQARSSDNLVDIVLAAGLTKNLAAVWVAGSGNGGRDAATALAALQSWHLFLIYNPTTLAVDALFSLSPTAPTLPVGFTKFRRIFSLPRLGTVDGAGAPTWPASGTRIPPYLQWGDDVLLKNPLNEFVGQTGNASPMLKDVGVPLGIKVLGQFYAQLNYATGITTLMKLSDPDLGIPPAFGGSDQYGHLRVSANELYPTAIVFEPTSAAGQLYVHVSQTGATWALKTRGWKDKRGQM